MISPLHRLASIGPLLGFVGGVAFIGALFFLALHSRFIFLYSEQYWNVARWVYLFLLPVIGATIRYKSRFHEHLSYRYPTHWVRSIFLFPLSVLIAAAMLVVAPVGWVSAATCVAGAERSNIEAILVAVEAPNYRIKGCRQHATLSIFSITHSVCVGDYSQGKPPNADQAVLVGGQESNFGFLIQHITPRK